MSLTRPRSRVARPWTALLLALSALPGASALAATAPAPLDLAWGIETNRYPPEAPHPASRGVLRLHPSTAQALGPEGWTLWFTSSATIAPGDLPGHLRLEGRNGTLYSLKPTTGFAGVAAGATLDVAIPYTDIVLKDTEAPQGPFIAYDREPGVGHTVAHYRLEPRVRPEQWPRDAPGRPARVTAEALYEQNRVIEPVSAEALPPVFPTPVAARRGEGMLHWSARPRIEAAPGLVAEAMLADAILGVAFPRPAPAATSLPLRLTIGAVGARRNPEAYRLEVDPRQGVTITGVTAAGVSRGLQSLRAWLPPAPRGGITLAAWTIEDEPRFAYRGEALDLARNFQPVSVVLRYLDLLARYKLNVLHLHLTDDEGWRLEIRGLPELTAVGARRGHTLDGLDHLPPAFGSGPDVDDPHGSGFLSREDFETILRRATALKVEVIPEIEMPGHARAAVKAMESRAARLARAADPEAARFRLSDPADHSKYESAQGYNDNVVNPGLESTYAFIDLVLDDIVSMYREAGAPLATIHVGGDELPRGAWSDSPACAALRQRLGLAGTAEVWDYFYGRVDGLLKARGLKASGWEELGSRRTKMHGEEKLVPNPTFVGSGATVYVWQNLWGAEDLGVRLANAGYRTVLAPVSAFYFDMAYNRNADEPGAKWAPFIGLDAAYDFIPFDFVRASPTDPTPVPGRDGLADFGMQNIAGLEGQMWSENLREVERIDYLMMPRLLGLAERAWAADPDWTRAADRVTAERLHARGWSVFVSQLGEQVLPRLDAERAGILYRIPPPGLRLEGERVLVNQELPGFVLRYTHDGSDPTAASPLVQGPIAERGRIRVAAFDRNGRMGRISEIEHR
jgi:hexosaminidase